MSDFEEFGSGPLIDMAGGEEFTPDCHTDDQVAAGCDPVLALHDARRTGVDSAPLADRNIGKLICHGLRDRTPYECELAGLMGKPAVGQICNLEILYRPVV